MEKSRSQALFRLGTPSLDGGSRLAPSQGGYGMVSPLGAYSRKAARMLLALSPLLLSHHALAQSSQGLFWQCVPASSSNPQPQYCPVSNQYPLPGGPAINALAAVVGTERNTVISAATGLTIPSGATVALVQAQGTNNTVGACGMWQDDGTAPTGTAGQALPANAALWIKASSAFKMIAATGATCTMTASYYK